MCWIHTHWHDDDTEITHWFDLVTFVQNLSNSAVAILIMDTDEVIEMERRKRRLRFLGYESMEELRNNLVKDDSDIETLVIDDSEPGENDDNFFGDITIVDDNKYAEALHENKIEDQLIAPPLSPTSEMNSKITNLLGRYKPAPKQTKLTLFFKSVQVYASEMKKISAPVARNQTKLTSFFKTTKKYSSKPNKIRKSTVKNRPTTQTKKKTTNTAATVANPPVAHASTVDIGSNRGKQLYIAYVYDWDDGSDWDNDMGLLISDVKGREPHAENASTVATEQPVAHSTTATHVNNDIFLKKTVGIEHKRNLVQISKADRSNGYRLKCDLMDEFWKIDVWPPYVVKVLLLSRFNYKDRLVLATFLHGNAMRNKEMAIRIVTTYNQPFKLMPTQDQNRKLSKFSALFEYLDKSDDKNDAMYEHIRTTYYYYDMRVKHMMYYNGKKRKKQQPAEFTRSLY